MSGNEHTGDGQEENRDLDLVFQRLRQTPIVEAMRLYRDSKTGEEKERVLWEHGWSVQGFLTARRAHIEEMFRQKWEREGYPDYED